MLYQPEEDEPTSSRPPWVKVVALLLVGGLVLMMAGATVQMLLAAI